MSRGQRSQTPADMLTRSRQKTGTANAKVNPMEGVSISGSSGSYQLFGPYARVVAKLRRLVNVLEADDGLSLPRVSVNNLERAASDFLQECRLGLPREGTSSSRPPVYSGRGARYGRKVIDELEQPERAARVRQNRLSVKEEIEANFNLRRRKK